MVVDPVFSITVDRLCRIRSGTDADDLPFPLSDDGFLDPLAVGAALTGVVAPGALVDPAAAGRTGALVLLGEPGIGKTTVFERLAEDRDKASEDSPCVRQVRVDAADLTEGSFDELLGRYIRALPARRSRSVPVGDDAPAGPGDRETAPALVVVDQLDESPLVRHFAGRLRLLLKDRDTSRLRFLVACRTADYPSRLTEVLRSACGECAVADLAPLTREEAVRLASSAEGIDGEALVAAAVQAGAGVLANTPLTLSLLVRSYRRFGHLNARPAELFAQGVRQLLEEPDSDRRIVDDDSSIGEREAIAGRIACQLLLTGRRTIWRGPVLESGDHDLDADTVAGGYERTCGGRFGVTQKMALATLGTALFTSRGDNRLAFAHGSFAAYLTARYLIDREIPQGQLERLFLVSGGDETRSIPVSLREAAAWLTTLGPGSSSWLVRADPESLVSHSPIIDSPEVRALIVEGLLDRAGEIEVGNLGWVRSRRHLQHPGLDAQLQAVLDASEDREPQDWPSLARVRLAIRLAREARSSGLAAPLLDLADSDGWSAVMRQMAARAAYETDPGRAIPRLVKLLERFADVGYATSADPDDELRGSLLTMLWPAHIKAEQLVRHLRRRRNRLLFGTYLGFEHRFAADLREEDLPFLLQWAAQQALPGSDQQGHATADDNPLTRDYFQFNRPTDCLDSEVTEGLMDRALKGPTALQHIESVGVLILPRLLSGDRPPLPAPAEGGGDGNVPPAATDLRRALALCLTHLTLNDGAFTPNDARAILWGWGHGRDKRYAGGRADGLLSASDFRWLYQSSTDAAHDGHQTLASAIAQIAATLFDPADTALAELVYANQDHPVWPFVEARFKPAGLESDQPKPMREALGQSRDDEDHHTDPWPEAEKFAVHVNRLLRGAVAGDPDAFWQLAWNLQTDPSTGLTVHRFDDVLLDLPGVNALDTSSVESLADASLWFLTHQHDHASEWLGTDRYDRRAWAGYLALSLLDRLGRLHEVPVDAWSSWAGAIVWFPSAHGTLSQRDRKRTLLSHAVRHAPAAARDAAMAYLRGQIAVGQPASEVELIDPAWDHRLADAWVAALDGIGGAIVCANQTEAVGSQSQPNTPRAEPVIPPAERDTSPGGWTVHHTDQGQTFTLELWETILISLFGGQQEKLAAISRHWMEAATASPAARLVAVRAIKVLLHVDARRYWPQIRPVIEHDKELGKAVAVACAASREERPLFRNADEEQLASAYRWLAEVFPPENDVLRQGFQRAEDQAWEWRNGLLHQLSALGTEQAVRNLAALSAEHPERLVITSNLLRARREVSASAWSPPPPSALAALIEDASRRLVRSENELAHLLVEVLDAIRQDLPGHCELLWDRLPRHVLTGTTLKEAWRPKPEAALSAYIAHELSNRLYRRGVAANREVLVRPTNAYGAGDRTDILVTATAHHDPDQCQAPIELSVVIEIKGPWNKDLLNDQRQQLAQRYLPLARSTTGIYLVGWYPIDLWTDSKDDRRRKASKFSREGLLAELEAQASDIGISQSTRTIPILLEIPRPFARNDEDEGDTAGT